MRRNAPKDPDGCVKPAGNHDWHEYIATGGERVEWKFDTCDDCDCEEIECTIWTIKKNG